MKVVSCLRGEFCWKFWGCWLNVDVGVSVGEENKLYYDVIKNCEILGRDL